jgi:hypothetical protein
MKEGLLSTKGEALAKDKTHRVLCARGTSRAEQDGKRRMREAKSEFVCGLHEEKLGEKRREGVARLVVR